MISTAPTQMPLRTPWNNVIPGAGVFARESATKTNPHYDAAKTGSISAAVDLVYSLVQPHQIRRELIGLRELDPLLVPVNGVEVVSDNVIPVALAAYIHRVTDFEMASPSLAQTNKAGHTGASGWHRIANPAVFEGDAEPGRNYILVDDFSGMGGTLASLRGYIEAKGGSVIKAALLTGKPRSKQIALQQSTLDTLMRHV